MDYFYISWITWKVNKWMQTMKHVNWKTNWHLSLLTTESISNIWNLIDEMKNIGNMQTYIVSINAVKRMLSKMEINRDRKIRFISSKEQCKNIHRNVRKIWHTQCQYVRNEYGVLVYDNFDSSCASYT